MGKYYFLEVMKRDINLLHSVVLSSETSPVQNVIHSVVFGCGIFLGDGVGMR